MTRLYLLLIVQIIVATAGDQGIAADGVEAKAYATKRVNPLVAAMCRSRPAFVGIWEEGSGKAREAAVATQASRTIPNVALGAVVDTSGLIVTNLSAVEKMKALEVIVAGQHLPAKLVERRPELDVAILQLDIAQIYPFELPLRSTALGASDRVQVGDFALVVQSTNLLFDVDKYCVSNSNVIVSRTPKPDAKLNELLRIDSPTSVEHDSGLLFDDKGKLVGLIVPQGDGSNAAAPIDAWKDLIERAAKNDAPK